jgi:hypothetical protein
VLHAVNLGLLMTSVQALPMQHAYVPHKVHCYGSWVRVHESNLLCLQGVKESRMDIIGNGRSKSGIFGEACIISTDGQSFDTVMAAIGSNRCLSCDVHLVVERLPGQ